MIHPSEFIVTNKIKYIFCLNKTLYGLKQAPLNTQKSIIY